MARPNKGALQRTRKSEVLVIAAFALSACEAFLIYRNFRMSVLESPTPTVSLLGGLLQGDKSGRFAPWSYQVRTKLPLAKIAAA